MTARHFVLTGIAAVVLAACAAAPSGEPRPEQMDGARATANQFAQTLGGKLKSAIKESGPESAISVCHDEAPKITAAISQEKDVKLRRVTFKSRNPDSVPDAWETKVLHDFEQRLAGGALPATLEYGEVVQNGDVRTFRYMKGLVMQGVCMTCHGTPETMPAGVQAKLAEMYPNDQATGYLPNMLRGAISIEKPM